MTSICVFCGARTGKDPRFRAAAIELGQEIARRGHTLVYGGGKVGLMGDVAQSALDLGGEVTGVIPDFLAQKEVLHPGLSHIVHVDDLFQRKARMIELSDAYVALPGGIGTLDELLEVIAWRQLNQLHGAIGVLDVASYFQPWFDALAHSIESGFVDATEIERIIRASSVSELLDAVS